MKVIDLENYSVTINKGEKHDTCFDIDFIFHSVNDNNFIIIDDNLFHIEKSFNDNKLYEHLHTALIKQLDMPYDQLLFLRTNRCDNDYHEVSVYNKDGSKASTCYNGVVAIGHLLLSRNGYYKQETYLDNLEVKYYIKTMPDSKFTAVLRYKHIQKYDPDVHDGKNLELQCILTPETKHEDMPVRRIKKGLFRVNPYCSLDLPKWSYRVNVGNDHVILFYPHNYNLLFMMDKLQSNISRSLPTKLRNYPEVNFTCAQFMYNYSSSELFNNKLDMFAINIVTLEWGAGVTESCGSARVATSIAAYEYMKETSDSDIWRDNPGPFEFNYKVGNFVNNFENVLFKDYTDQYYFQTNVPTNRIFNIGKKLDGRLAIDVHNTYTGCKELKKNAADLILKRENIKLYTNTIKE